jgi:hypothetical protein
MAADGQRNFFWKSPVLQRVESPVFFFPIWADYLLSFTGKVFKNSVQIA